MKRCDMALEELSAFVDGELDAAGELELRRHLDVCSRCTKFVAGLTHLKTAVGRSAVTQPVPPALMREVRRAAPRVRVRQVSGPFAAILAASVLLVVGVLVWMQRAQTDTPLHPFGTVLVADHVHYAYRPDRLQVEEADPAALSRWFAARLPFQPEFPAVHGAQIVGGRVCDIQGNQLALAFLEDGGERLSMFIGDAEMLTDDARRAWASVIDEQQCRDAMQGYRVCFARQGRLVSAIVGPARLLPPA